MIRRIRGSALTRSRWAGIGAAVAVSLGAGGIGLIVHAADSAPSSFVSITPCRLFDTRPAPDTIGTRSTPLNAGEDFERQVWGNNGNCAIPTTATGISYNLTVPTAITGFLAVYPADAALPRSSSINPVGGEGVKANSGMVGLSATGAIKVYTLTGPLNALLDITGYFLPATGGGGVGPVGPVGPTGPIGPTGPTGPSGATGISTGHIDGATGLPNPNFAKTGTWTSTRTGTGQYRITIPSLLISNGAGGCMVDPTRPLPNPVVSVWNINAVTPASAVIIGTGSGDCPPGDWQFFVQITVDGFPANSDFTVQFVTP